VKQLLSACLIVFVAGGLSACRGPSAADSEASANASRLAGIEPASAFLASQPIPLDAELAENTDPHPNVIALPGCSDPEIQHTFFKSPEMFFTSVNNPNGGPTFVLRQAYGYAKGRGSFGPDKFSSDPEIAERQAKILMAYNIFEGARIEAAAQVKVNLKTAEALLACMKGARSDCVQQDTYIATLKERAKEMYQVRAQGGFKLQAGTGTASDGEMNLVDSNDPALKILAAYPVLSFFPSDAPASETETNEAIKSSIGQLIDLSNDKLAEFDDMDYLGVLQFPGSIALSILDQIGRLQKEKDSPDAPLVAGTYCNMLSEIYKENESLDKQLEILKVVGLIGVSLATLPFGAMGILLDSAVSGASLYSDYANAQDAIFRCQTAVGQGTYADQCSSDDLQHLASLEPGPASVVATGIVGGAGLVSVGRGIARAMGKTKIVANSVESSAGATANAAAQVATCAATGALSLTADCSIFSKLFIGLGKTMYTVKAYGGSFITKPTWTSNKNVAVVVNSYKENIDLRNADEKLKVIVIIKKAAYERPVQSEEAVDVASKVYTYGKELTYAHKNFGTRAASEADLQRYAQLIEQQASTQRIVAANAVKAGKAYAEDIAEDLIQAFRNETGFTGEVLVEGVHVNLGGASTVPTYVRTSGDQGLLTDLTGRLDATEEMLWSEIR
jgi:hypothetical protein